MEQGTKLAMGSIRKHSIPFVGDVRHLFAIDYYIFEYMTEYIQFAEEMAKKAGTIIKEHFGLGMQREFKSDSSPVTEADLKINSLLITEVKRLFPEHSVIGEEESHIVENSEYAWVCDPLDGTRAFTSGLPLAAHSLALVKNGEVILGVVYDPFCDRLYSAQKGQGTTLNGVKTVVSKVSNLQRAVSDIESSNTAKYDTTELRNQLIKDYHVVNYKLCAIVLPSALVAAGEVAFTVFPHASAHDIAAVKIIVEEAGGKVTDIYGNEQRYDQAINGALISNGLLHDQLVEMAKQFVKEN
jgi:fructose-1,6-bisphosphatase/inositol monophosphatase family enzyme